MLLGHSCANAFYDSAAVECSMLCEAWLLLLSCSYMPCMLCEAWLLLLSCSYMPCMTSAVYGMQVQLNSLICIHLYVALVHSSYCIMHVA